MRKLLRLALIVTSLSFSGCAPITSTATPPSSPVPEGALAPIAPYALSSLPSAFPKIDRRPAPAYWGRGSLTSAPTYNPDSDQMWQMDLRAYDLSQLDLRYSFDDLMYADFDSQTKWPLPDRMPNAFDWQRILEMGKNPGLGIRQLHALGITGYGVGIAIIDQTLLVDHQEYASQLRLYEETDDIRGGLLETQMHGPAVASIAVGRTVGVAPDADLYYIASALCGTGTYESVDFACLAQSVRRILDMNTQLPKDRRIRVISMSIGWGAESRGYSEITAAVREAKAAGMLVICSSVEEVHGFEFHGLGRLPLADPDTFQSYEPGLWWARQFYADQGSPNRLLVPMDSRTVASPGGVDEYAFYREGGWSWSIPYIAGVFALVAQVKPTVTPDEFWALALNTGQSIELSHEDKAIRFGPILDPVSLIGALEAN